VASDVFLEFVPDVIGKTPLDERTWRLALAEPIDAGAVQELLDHVLTLLGNLIGRNCRSQDDTRRGGMFNLIRHRLLQVVRKGGFEPPRGLPTRS
jgi:hypothetical protein